MMAGISDLSDGWIHHIGEDPNPTDAFKPLVIPALQGHGDLPKELFYTDQRFWDAIALSSKQTSEEIDIIEKSAEQVCQDLPSGTVIVDLGAASSVKYEGYVWEMIHQQKTCVYAPLDLQADALQAQVDRAHAKFSKYGIKVVGLLGSFEDGDAYFRRARGSDPARLFLSLGSIFFNAPDSMCAARCWSAWNYLAPVDRLIVGQSAPDVDAAKVHDAYSDDNYKVAIKNYLGVINDVAGIEDTPEKAWTWESKVDDTMHFFELTARKNLVCHRSTNGPLYIAKGQHFPLFKSWKREAGFITQLATICGLHIEENARQFVQQHRYNMRQFLIRHHVPAQASL